MSAGFTFTDYAFNNNRSLPANAALGIFSAADFAPNGNPYGSGGDDTIAVQGALNRAAQYGGIAFLTPPPSGSVNVSATLIANSGVWLVGASPDVRLRVVPGANLDWLIATGEASAVDYRTVFTVNYRNLTLGGNPYTGFDPAHPTALAVGGGLMNLTIVGDNTQASGLGHGLMLNAASGFQLANVGFQNFVGEAVSLWDCMYLIAQGILGLNNGRLFAIHRASYDVSLIGSASRNSPNPSYITYTEQFQIPNGPLLTLTPFYTKFVDAHHYSTVQSTAGFDLGGPAYVNMTSCTADNISGGQFYEQETRFGSVPFAILTDVAASGVTAVSVTAPITDSGTASHPNIGLDTPLPVADGGSGSASPSLIEGTGIHITGSWPDQTIDATIVTLEDLQDVLITSVANGDALVWDSGSSKWINASISGGFGGGGPAPTIVQSDKSSGNGVSSVTFTFATTPADGNMLIFWVACNANRSITPPSGCFLLNVIPVGIASPYQSLYAFGKVANAESNSYTFTISTSDELRVVGAEINDWGNWDLRQANVVDNFGNGIASVPTFVPLTKNALCFAAFTCDTTQGAVATPSGWSVLQYAGNDGNNHTIYVAHLAVSSYPTAVSCSITWPSPNSSTNPNLPSMLLVMHAK